MKKFLTIIFAGLFALAISSCGQNPNVVVVQPQQSVPVQSGYQDPNQFYNDPEYANQPPVLQNINGQQVLVDAALMAYIGYYHYNLGSYYSAYPTVNHFHVYRNGVYSGYPRGYHSYVASTSYHYHAPNPTYVTRSGAPDMRYKANRPNSTVRPSATPAPRQYNLRPSAATTPAQPSQARTLSLRKPTPPAAPRSAPRTMSLRKH